MGACCRAEVPYCEGCGYEGGSCAGGVWVFGSYGYAEVEDRPGEGVGVAVSAFLKNATVYEVDYCAYVELKRPIFKEGQSFTAGEFEVLTRSDQTGVGYFLPSP